MSVHVQGSNFDSRSLELSDMPLEMLREIVLVKPRIVITLAQVNRHFQSACSFLLESPLISDRVLRSRYSFGELWIMKARKWPPFDRLFFGYNVQFSENNRCGQNVPVLTEATPEHEFNDTLIGLLLDCGNEEESIDLDFASIIYELHRFVYKHGDDHPDLVKRLVSVYDLTGRLLIPVLIEYNFKIDHLRDSITNLRHLLVEKSNEMLRLINYYNDAEEVNLLNFTGCVTALIHLYGYHFHESQLLQKGPDIAHLMLSYGMGGGAYLSAEFRQELKSMLPDPRVHLNNLMIIHTVTDLSLEFIAKWLIDNPKDKFPRVEKIPRSLIKMIITGCGWFGSVSMTKRLMIYHANRLRMYLVDTLIDDDWDIAVLFHSKYKQK